MWLILNQINVGILWLIAHQWSITVITTNIKEFEFTVRKLVILVMLRSIFLRSQQMLQSEKAVIIQFFSYSKKMKHALFSVVLKYEIRKRLLQFAESQIKFLACADKPWCENFPFCKDSQALRDRIVGDCPIQCKELRCKAYWKAEITESDPVAIEDAPSQEGTNAFWVFITRGRERATFLNNWHYNNFFITLRAFYLNTLLRVNRESLLSIENWFDERYAKIKFYIYWNLDFFRWIRFFDSRKFYLLQK